MEIPKTSSKKYERKIKQSSYNTILKIRIIIKRTIPLIIGAFLIIVFFWPTLLSNTNKNNLRNIGHPILGIKDLDSENFNFQGIDDFEQPFYMHAKKYQIIENDKNKLLFKKPKAEINLQNGKWVTLIAKKGIFDIKGKSLELIDNVLVLHSDGQQLTTNRAIIDMAKGEFYGNTNLFGVSDAITFNSEGFNVKKRSGNFSLIGKSKIKIKQ